MFCVRCGSKIPDNSNSCLKCGESKKQLDVFVVSDKVVDNKNPAIRIILFIILVLLMMAGVYLPCYTVVYREVSESILLIDGDGIYIIMAAIVAMILRIVGRKEYVLIPAGIASLLLLNFTVQFVDCSGYFNVGFYMMWAGALALTLLSSMEFINRRLCRFSRWQWL